MVAYELSLIMKLMPRAELVQSVRRIADMLSSHKGFLEKIEFLGTRSLPYRISRFGNVYDKGSYFMIHYHAPYTTPHLIKDDCQRNLDVIRNMVSVKEVNEPHVCTLHEEILPPAYREDVKKMAEEADERMPKNLKMRAKRREQLKNYKF